MNREPTAALAPGATDRSRFAAPRSPVIRHLGLVEYAAAYDAMRRFSAARDASTPDELWVLQHPPVYTTGLAGRSEHFPRSGIPVERIDRGGQITYHGPGQAVVYTLLDLSRRDLRVRQLVQMIEQAVIGLLAGQGIAAARKPGAPGVYVEGAKIAALGLRVRKGCCYHGVALNVDMGLAPFAAIDPCGFPGLAVTQTRDLGIAAGTDELGEQLATHIIRLLGS